MDTVTRAAREKTVEFFGEELAPGSTGEVLDQAARSREELDQLNHAMATALARIEASGQLLGEGEQCDLTRWIRHTFGTCDSESRDFAAAGRASVHQSIPETIETLTDGMLSFGESAAIIKSAERETMKRDVRTNESPESFRTKMECGLLSFKKAHPTTSVAGLAQAGQQIWAV